MAKEINMRTTLFVLLCVFVTGSYQKKQTFADLKAIWQSGINLGKEKCLRESGADPLLAARLMPYGEYVDDYPLKCFVKCVSVNLDVLDNKYSTLSESYLKVMAVEDERIISNAKIIDKCFAIQLEDPCESAFEISKCVYKSVETEFQTLQ